MKSQSPGTDTIEFHILPNTPTRKERSTNNQNGKKRAQTAKLERKEHNSQVGKKGAQTAKLERKEHKQPNWKERSTHT